MIEKFLRKAFCTAVIVDEALEGRRLKIGWVLQGVRVSVHAFRKERCLGISFSIRNQRFSLRLLGQLRHNRWWRVCGFGNDLCKDNRKSNCSKDRALWDTKEVKWFARHAPATAKIVNRKIAKKKRKGSEAYIGCFALLAIVNSRYGGFALCNEVVFIDVIREQALV